MWSRLNIAVAEKGCRKMTDFKEAKKLVNECGLNIKEPLHSEVLKVINEALEKQMPKKPTIKITGSTGWNTTTFCPACKGEVLKEKYCVHCGQRLDWGQEDDR